MTSSFLIQRRRFVGAGLLALVAPAIGNVHANRKPFGEVDSFVADEMRRANIPGLALGVASHGVVRFVQGYGYADIERRRPVSTETMFHIASVTKTVTATAIMQLVADGKLKLDEPVSGYLDFPLSNPHHPDAPITFRQLLMHTSSISDAKYYEVEFRQRGRDSTLPLASFLKDYLVPDGRVYSKDTCFSKAVPGSAWDYSNVGYGLLGYVASRVGNQDMREQTRERIFMPLGMRHTSWTISGTPEPLRATPYDDVNGVLAPAEPVGFPDWATGMLRSSIADFTRFVAASANGGTAGRNRIVDARAMAEMLDMKTPSGLPGWLSGQGLGWAASKLEGAEMPNHWGGDPGVFTAAYLDPPNRTGVAIFTNATASNERKTAVKSIASRLLNKEVR
jgi:CubicO group peptidase (beta-lactamase class C family)